MSMLMSKAQVITDRLGDSRSTARKEALDGVCPAISSSENQTDCEIRAQTYPTAE